MHSHPISNFKYSHTIQPDINNNNNNILEDQLDDLFKIGNDYIEPEQKIPIQIQSSESQSSAIEREKKIHKKDKKNKKLKKQKKQKKQKKKKHKKDKTNYQKDIEIITNPVHILPFTQQDPLQKLFSSDFLYNQRLDIYTLPVSVIKFPEQGLLQYGISIQTIPRYRRVNYNTVIGIGSSNQTSQILRQLNIKINQVNPSHKQEDPNNRYFHFEISQIRETVKPLRTKLDADPYFITFDTKEWATFNESDTLKTLAIDYRKLDQTQSQLLKSNKQYNLSLSKDPNNIQMWISFIDAQENLIGGTDSKDSKGWLVQRKLSILQRAITLNPNSAKLRIKELQLINSKRPDDYYKIILQKSRGYLEIFPESIEMWELYIHHKFSHFATFSGYDITSEIIKIKQSLNSKINEAKSAVLVWNLRRVLMHVTFILVRLLNLVGYRELTTSICVSLIEFNIFVPDGITPLTAFQLRVNQFKKYWNDIKAYRLGQVQQMTCWQNSKIQQAVTTGYIGQIQQQSQIVLLGGKQIYLESWRPARAKVQTKRIIASPYSYVMFEDIQPFLYAYKDKQNTQRLVDYVFQCLGFPPVFSAQNSKDSVFSTMYLQMRLKALIDSKDAYSRSQSDKPDFWLKFWSLEDTPILISVQFASKMIYIKRLLQHLRLKFQSLQIDLYLLFIQSCIYLTPQLQNLLYSEATSKDEISKIIQSNLSSVQVWVGYLHTQYLRFNSHEECFNIYIQLLQSNKESDSIFKLLYFLLINCSKWKYKVHTVLKMIFQFLSNNNINFQQEREISPFEALQFQHVLAQKYQKMPSTEYTLELGVKDMLKYFILRTSNMFEPSAGLKSIQQNVLFQCRQNATVKNSLLLLRTQNNRIRMNLCSLIYHSSEVVVAECLMKGYNQPIFMLQSHIQPSLQLWLKLLLFLRHPTSRGKEMGLEDNLNSIWECNSNLVLIKLVQNGPDRQFSKRCLSRMPYCKQLFQMIIGNDPDPFERQRISKLLEQKMLRI